MEQVGPRAPLDSQINVRRIVSILCLFGGAFWAPLFASAHGTEFLLAKLTFTQQGRATLEITADWENNPLLEGRDHAARVLPGALQWMDRDQARSLSDLSLVTLEDRSVLDPTCPLPPEAFETSGNHRLLTARFEWQAKGESLQFQVPAGSKHDVLLWMIDPMQPQDHPRWMMLLGGDVTRLIPVPKSQARPFPIVGMVTLIFALSALFLWRRRLLNRELQSRPPSADLMPKA